MQKEDEETLSAARRHHTPAGTPEPAKSSTARRAPVALMPAPGTKEPVDGGMFRDFEKPRNALGHPRALSAPAGQRRGRDVDGKIRFFREERQSVERRNNRSQLELDTQSQFEAKANHSLGGRRGSMEKRESAP